MSPNSPPRLSVLLPVRDAAPWLAASLASLARQTEPGYELIAVDDGSRDESGEILEAASRRDPRIVVRHTSARGLPAALNLALSLARAPWIARHDADDVSHRERFARQLAWLDAHPGVDVLGTRLRLFPGAATGAGMRRWAAWHNALLEHEPMQRELLIDSPLAHGTAMIRRATLQSAGGWRELGWAEDLDLWVRLFRAGARFSKLRETLYGWRQHPASSTRTDERYSHVRFMTLKVAALDAGLLRRGRRATLVGVGSSLQRWRAALGTRVAACVEIRRPGPGVAPHWATPVVLALMAPEARRRWRESLARLGWRELREFIFVA
ncbi:MAG TPA: glycosyltransferase [Candidatus Eisenbacteria bacterium]|jgi:glycosyltransferase involved in cell wall biosynthesis